ncbi:amyloid fiber anchoring/assembly protein TapA [Robertmurraya sp. Marseille-Q9965]
MKFLFTFRKRFLFTIVAIVFVFLLTTSLVTSSTEAYYIDSEQWDSVIQVGTWWDKSDLQFTTEQQSVVSCTPVEITAGITNKGFSMIGTSEYEVYYSNSAPSTQVGEKVAQGVIAKMETNSGFDLSYIAEKSGTYTFKIFQRPGYQENYETRAVVWSEKINVSCIDKTSEAEPTAEEKPKEGTEQQNPPNVDLETEPMHQEQQEPIEEQQEPIEEQQEPIEEQHVQGEQEVPEVPEAQVIQEDDQEQDIQEEQDELGE